MNPPLWKRLIQLAASPSVMFYTMPWLMVLIVIGTVSQPEMGLHGSVERFFASWVIWFNFMPLPGGMLTIAILTLNLTARFLFKSTWQWGKSGIHLTHLGVLILLYGGLLTASFACEYYMIIPEGKASNALYGYQDGEIRITPPATPQGVMSWGKTEARLPFQIMLRDFVRNDHPGTTSPKSYHSDVTVTLDSNMFDVRINMNEPLRYGGYTFFQSSFIDVGGRQATVLQVTRNSAALFPYVATIIIALGLTLHIWILRRRAAS